MPRPIPQRIDPLRVPDAQSNRAPRIVGSSPTLAANTRPAKNEMLRLAESLAPLAPRIAELLTDRGAQMVYEGEIKEQEAGKAGYVKGESSIGKSEAWQRGYMNMELRARAQEDLKVFEQEYLENFDKDHGDFDAFSKEFWRERTKGLEVDPLQLKAYVQSVESGIAKIREADFNYKTSRVIERQNANAMVVLDSEIRKIIDAGKPLTGKDLDRIRADIQANISVSNKDFNAMVWEVLQGHGLQGNFQVFDALKDPHTDGTPGMYFIPEYTQKIDAARIHALNVFLNKQNEANNLLEKERKAKVQEQFLPIVTTAISGDFDRALLAFDAMASNEEWAATPSETIDLRNSLMSLRDKMEETPSQLRYATSLMHDVWSMKIKDPTVITQAAVQGYIHWSKAQALLQDIYDIEQNERARARDGRERLQDIYNDPRVRLALSALRSAVGADALNLGEEREQRELAIAGATVELLRKLATGEVKPEGAADWAEKTGNMYRKRVEGSEARLIDIPNIYVEQGKAAAQEYAATRPGLTPETLRLREQKEAYEALLRNKKNLTEEQYRREKQRLDAIYRPR